MAVPSKAHFEAFGALLYHYATAETGLKICLCGIMNANLTLMLILTDPYSAINLRKVVKSIAKMHEWPPGALNKLMQIVGDLKVHGPLRNHVAHSRWTDGARPGAIKPRGVDIRNEKPVFLGDDPSEPDWTAPEIMECARKLAAVNLRILQFNDEMGFTARIEQKMASANARTD